MRVERNSLAGHTARMLSWMGQAWCLVWIALIPAAVFRKPRLSARSLVGLVVVLVLVNGLKAGFGRTRPYPTGNDSFPSGDAAAVVMLATLWSAFLSRARWGLCLFAVVICLARVSLGRHWASDVTFGAILGHVVGRLCTVTFAEPLLNKPERLIPVAQFLLMISLVVFIIFDSRGTGKFARLFGPSLFLAVFWAMFIHGADVRKWLTGRRDLTSETS